jgi:hypothetical protein
MVDAGIRPSNKYRRVGEYHLGSMIAEGPNYQDWEGQHVSIETIRRRVRIYTFARPATEQSHKTLVAHAAREFQILEDIDHPGILKARDYKEALAGHHKTVLLVHPGVLARYCWDSSRSYATRPAVRVHCPARGC